MKARHRIIHVIDGLIYLLVGPFTVIGTVPLLLIQADTAIALSRFTSAELSTAGYLLMDLGGLLAIWCSWLMHHGGGTPIPSLPATRLVSSGPYAYVRHPMMYSLLIVGLGELLVTGSILILLWIPVAIRAGVLFIAAYEEPVLLNRFKGEYKSYCEQVPRWLPTRLNRK
jgi:protein-S-isoprenylcysteine O-methyltransferase Ste14